MTKTRLEIVYKETQSAVIKSGEADNYKESENDQKETKTKH